MHYHQRHPEKAITEREQLSEVLREGNVVTLALCRGEEPYLVTVNYVFHERESAIYFHCAGQGKKVDYLTANPRVWGQVFIDKGYMDGDCDHRYRTVQFAAVASIVSDESAKREALSLLIRHLESDPEPVLKRLLGRPEPVAAVTIVKLSLIHITGKENQMEQAVQDK